VSQRCNIEIRQAGLIARRADSVVRRTVQRERQDRYYWTVDTVFRGASSLLDDLFGYGDTREVLFQLPNGLLAYQSATDWSYVTAAEAHSPAREVVSCHACHQQGILPVKDVARGLVEANPTLYDRETFADVQQTFPLPAQFDALIEADNRLLASAFERAGLSQRGPDPLSYVYYQFELEPLSLARTAAELGVAPDELQAQLPNLQGRVRWLMDPTVTIPRRILEEAYLQNWCILHAEGRNQPVSCPW
jgi:hypothetical protein